MTAEELHLLRDIFSRACGFMLREDLKFIAERRLAPRLELLALRDFTAYARYLRFDARGAEELETAIDLLVPHETYFFREPKHFEFLREQAVAARAAGRGFRVWSAASSSGEEAYSVAMVLADCLGEAPWEVLGTDISLQVLQRAARGVYPMERARHVPPAFLRRFCLKGTDRFDGTLLISKDLRRRVRFGQVNLNEPLPDVGTFDLVLLRNVMIYFSNETKQGVVSRVATTIRHGGHFCIGHSETLNGLNHALEQLAPSIYRRAGP